MLRNVAVSVVLLLAPDAFGGCETGVVTFAAGRTSSAVLYVAANGSDAGGDGSADRPYATLSFAIRFAAPGKAVRLLPGTYPGGTFLTDIAGTAEAPIWIGGFDGLPRPLIQGGSEGLHLTRTRYVVLENLEIAGSANNGVNCDDGGDYANPDATRFMVFRNLFIHDIGGGGNQDALKLSGVDDFWVLDSEFARSGGKNSGSGVDQVGCHHGLIARCFFHDLSGNAVQCKGGTEDVEIRNCRIVNAGQRGINIGGSTGFSFFRPPLSPTASNVEARDIRVIANHFRGSVTPLAFVGCRDSLAAHNTIIDPGNWLLRILQETTSSGGFAFHPCADNAFVNNLVYFDRGGISTYVNIGPHTEPGSFTFANNLWYARDQPGESAPSLPVAEADGIYGLDPLLAAPDRDLVDVPHDSPAAGRGRRLDGLSTDLAGGCYTDPPTIGAREATPSDFDGDGMPDWWETRYGLARFDAGDAGLDDDGDGAPNRDEYRAGTRPDQAGSLFRIRNASRPNAAVVVEVATEPGKTYAMRTGSPDAGWGPPTSFVATGSHHAVEAAPANPGGWIRLEVNGP